MPVRKKGIRGPLPAPVPQSGRIGEAIEVQRLTSLFPFLTGRVVLFIIYVLTSVLIVASGYAISGVLSTLTETKREHHALGEKVTQTLTDREVVKQRLTEVDKNIAELKGDVREVQRDMRELLRRVK